MSDIILILIKKKKIDPKSKSRVTILNSNLDKISTKQEFQIKVNVGNFYSTEIL